MEEAVVVTETCRAVHEISEAWRRFTSKKAEISGASPGEVAVEQPEAVQDPVVIKASTETCCPKTSLSASEMLLFEALYLLWTRGLALGGGQAFTGYGSEDDCSCKDL